MKGEEKKKQEEIASYETPKKARARKKSRGVYISPRILTMSSRERAALSHTGARRRGLAREQRRSEWRIAKSSRVSRAEKVELTRPESGIGKVEEFKRRTDLGDESSVHHDNTICEGKKGGVSSRLRERDQLKSGSAYRRKRW